MAHSVTVEFDDGTSHVYDNVPDTVNNAQIQERAQTEFPDKTMANINHVSTPVDAPDQVTPSTQAGGAAAAPAPVAPTAPGGAAAPQDPSLAAKAVGAVQTAAHYAGELGVTPTNAAATLAGGGALYKGNQMVNAARQGIDAYSQAAAAKTAAQNAATARSAARFPGPNPATYGPAPAAPGPVPPAGPAPAGPVAPGGAPAVNPAQAANAVAAGEPAMAAESAPSLFSRAGTLASKYAPMLAKLGVAAQLALHSGDLNSGEDAELAKRRALADFQKRNGQPQF